MRTGLGEVGGGHWSPLVSYSSQHDAFLLLDVTRYKYVGAFFSLIWLITTCHDSLKLGDWLKGLAVLMIFLNPILFLVLEF